MKKFLILFTLLTLFWSCANIQAPSGGPQDTTPPEIVTYSPENNSINFEDREIRIKFNKYMNKAKVIENLSISPIVDLKHSWSGKELRINIDGDLDTNLTYLINLGTEYSDLHGNKPDAAFNLVFSAGSKIDSGMIHGKSPNDANGYVAFLYNLNNKSSDTINPAHTFPDYRVQLGTSGEFTFAALKDGIYRLMLIKDEFKNNLYDPVDAYSSALNDIEVRNSVSKLVAIKPGSIIDVQGPELREVYPEFSDFIVLTFDEQPAPKALDKQYFSISDTMGNPFEMASVFNYPDEPNKVLVSMEQSLDTGKTYIVKADISVMSDTLGNKSIDSLVTKRFRTPFGNDPAGLTVFSFDLADSAGNVPTMPVFRMVFNRGINIDLSQVDSKITNTTDSSTMEMKYSWKSANVLELTTTDTLQMRANYDFNLSLKLIGSKSTHSLDTNVNRNFTSGGRKALGSASGTIYLTDNFCESDVYLIFMSSSNVKYLTKVADAKWSIKDLPEGEYTIEAFCDIDGNGAYSFGYPYPYVFSEPFVIFENRVTIKARWNIEDINLKVHED
ncbi:MAG: Ig-like domain-containing protein [Candidatus Kapabacteria bacterium]|nr:Ig-like domain-containing protein [Candidatus Kapabacteria bacterium]